MTKKQANKKKKHRGEEVEESPLQCWQQQTARLLHLFPPGNTELVKTIICGGEDQWMCMQLYL